MFKKGIFYILFIGFNCSLSQECFTLKYDTVVLNKDVMILKKVLLFNHPSVGVYGEKNFFKGYWDTSLHIKNSMTEKAFRMFLKSKLKILHCGHTNILPSKKYMKCLDKKKFKVIPYFITYDNYDLVVVKGFEKQDTLLKNLDTILQIDGISSRIIVENIKQYLYTDGSAESAKYEMIQRHFTFYFSGLMEKDSFLLTIKNKEGIKNVIIKTRAYLKVKNELMEMKTDTLLKYRRNKYFVGLFLNKQKNVYYMKINSFSGIQMRRLFRQAFRSMQKNKTEYLILDLRNNPGGKIAQSKDLLSYLLSNQDSLFYQKTIYTIAEKKYIRRKLEYRIIDFFIRLRSKRLADTNMYVEKIPVRKKYAFKGKVYLIVNAHTFSAANLIAIYLTKRPGTIIAGSETSGVQWGSNAVSFFRLYLPHTRVRVLIPTYRIIHNVLTDKNSLFQPLHLNIPIYYTADDLLLKKDKELEAIYKDIMQNLNK